MNARTAVRRKLRRRPSKNQRRLVKQLVGEPTTRTRHCVYCGLRLKTEQVLTCIGHSDLPALDPAYAVEMAA